MTLIFTIDDCQFWRNNYEKVKVPPKIKGSSLPMIYTERFMEYAFKF